MVWLSEMGKYSKDHLHFLLPGMGKGTGAQSEKGHLCCSRHRWQVCGKGWARVSGCAPHHPVLLRRTWDVRGKRG